MERQCLGVFPFSPTIRLQAEDGVSLDDAVEVNTTVAAVRLPHISNFTDFDSLRVRWIERPDDGRYTHVILPGTKNTTGDLAWMRERELDDWVVKQHAAGAYVIGVCGGYQMLGESVDNVSGLGLLPVRTTMQPEKTVQRARARMASGSEFDAYEIHMGLTEVCGGEPFAYVNGSSEGVRTGRCIGTYLHGALQDRSVCEELGLRYEPVAAPYEALAEWFQSNADVKLFEELYL